MFSIFFLTSSYYLVHTRLFRWTQNIRKEQLKRAWEQSTDREVSLENSICAAKASTNLENKWWLGEESERGTERGRSRNFPWRQEINKIFNQFSIRCFSSLYFKFYNISTLHSAFFSFCVIISKLYFLSIMIFSSYLSMEL